MTLRRQREGILCIIIIYLLVVVISYYFSAKYIKYLLRALCAVKSVAKAPGEPRYAASTHVKQNKFQYNKQDCGSRDDALNGGNF